MAGFDTQKVGYTPQVILQTNSPISIGGGTSPAPVGFSVLRSVAAPPITDPNAFIDIHFRTQAVGTNNSKSIRMALGSTLLFSKTDGPGQQLFRRARVRIFNRNSVQSQYAFYEAWTNTVEASAPSGAPNVEWAANLATGDSTTGPVISLLGRVANGMDTLTLSTTVVVLRQA